MCRQTQTRLKTPGLLVASTRLQLLILGCGDNQISLLMLNMRWWLTDQTIAVATAEIVVVVGGLVKVGRWKSSEWKGSDIKWTLQRMGASASMTVGDSVGMVLLFPWFEMFGKNWLSTLPPGPGLPSGEGFLEGALHSTLIWTHWGGTLSSPPFLDQAQRQHWRVICGSTKGNFSKGATRWQG